MEKRARQRGLVLGSQPIKFWRGPGNAYVSHPWLLHNNSKYLYRNFTTPAANSCTTLHCYILLCIFIAPIEYRDCLRKTAHALGSALVLGQLLSALVSH